MITSANKASIASRHQGTTNASTSDTPSTSITPLPPDVADARKARMNADLIDAFKQPCPPDTTPYVTGIGLYTHVEGPLRAPQYSGENPQPEPEFLPIRIPESRRKPSSQPDEAVAKLWKEVEAAVKTEEKAIGTTVPGFNELRKRHGALPPPKNSKSPVDRVQRQTDGMQGATATQNGTTTSVGNMGAPTNLRSHSLSGVLATLAAGNENAGGGSTDAEQARSLTTVSTTGFYAPDPRRQGR
jgi:hypothetical protein